MTKWCLILVPLRPSRPCRSWMIAPKSTPFHYSAAATRRIFGGAGDVRGIHVRRGRPTLYFGMLKDDMPIYETRGALNIYIYILSWMCFFEWNFGEKRTCVKDHICFAPSGVELPQLGGRFLLYTANLCCFPPYFRSKWASSYPGAFNRCGCAGQTSELISKIESDKGRSFRWTGMQITIFGYLVPIVLMEEILLTTWDVLHNPCK